MTRVLTPDICVIGAGSGGLSVAALEAAIESDPRIAAVYVTPHHQYPTTVTMGAARRLKLLDSVERHGITLIEDDYDHEYRFEGRPVLPLAARAPAGLPLIYVGSLSKLLSPGIRLGYAMAPEPLLGRMAAARAAIDRQGDAPLVLRVKTMGRGSSEQQLRVE